ncbi:MAG: leucine-rich repeat protein [Treponema sp.]|jgi:hypothetical protein|nr:leucine-rich repeat protein [Treponema sp.]
MEKTMPVKKRAWFLCGLFALAALFFTACPNPAQSNNPAGDEDDPSGTEGPLNGLKSLALSGDAVLSPAFDSEIANYTVNVPTGVTELAVTAEPADPGYILSANNGVPQPLAAGSSTAITITVKTRDKTRQRRYIVVVRRAGENADTDPVLNAITLDAGTLEPVLREDTFNYTVALPFETESLAIEAYPRKETTTVTGTGVKALEPGENEFTITTVAEDGTRLDYSILAHRGSDVNLKTLSVSEGVLDPAFDPKVTRYAIELGSHIDSLVVEAAAANELANVEGTGEKTLQVGKNTVLVTVSAEDGAAKTYTLDIVKAGNENGNWIATLDSLSVARRNGDASGLTLSPPFDPETFSYTVEGWNNEDSITINALKTDPASGIDISPGEGDTPGVESAALVPGPAVITITLTSENGRVHNVYTIAVYRKSSNVALTGLHTDWDSTVTGLNNRDLVRGHIRYTGYYTHPVPGFSTDAVLNSGISPAENSGDPNKFELYCDDMVGWIKFNPLPADSRALISGDAGKTWYLDELKEYVFSFAITAEDGVTSADYSYIVTRVHAKNDDSALKSLAPSTGAFLQTFSPDTASYSMVVSRDLSSIAITGEANHDTPAPGGTAATISANNGVPQPLNTGANEITITVTAENGDTRDYVITVIRSTVNLGTEPFPSLLEMEAWLKSRPANTVSDPYQVVLASSLSFDALKSGDGRFVVVPLGQLFTVLDNAKRYIAIDLSNVTGAPSHGLGTAQYSQPGVEYLVEAALPSDISSIAAGMFRDCVNLKEIDLSAYTSLVSIGERAFRQCSWEGLKLPSGLETIGPYAFWSSHGFTSLSFPASLTAIGDSAFAACSALHTIAFDNGMSGTIGESAFADCSSLATVNFPAGISAIGNRAFAGTALVTADLSATAIALFYPAAFSDCPNLETLNLPSGTTSSWYWDTWDRSSNKLHDVPNLKLLTIPATHTIPEEALPFTLLQGTDLKFAVAPEHPVYEAVLDGRALVNKTLKKLLWGPSLSGEITIPPGVSLIGRYAFSKNTNITKVVISDEVRTLEPYAFEGCATQVVLGTKLRELANNVFYGNSNMGDLAIPANIRIIRANAFNSAGVQKVTLQNGITTIEDSAFVNSTLASINFPASIVTLGAAFGGTQLSSVDLSALETVTEIRGFNNCPNLVSVILPPRLFTLGAGAFEGSGQLANIALPSMVTVIGNRAFKGCAALTDIVLPSGVVSIGDEAFSGSGLVSATFPENLAALGNSAFGSCASLEWVEFLYEEAPVAANSNAFPADSTVFRAIYVPDLLFTAYVGTETSPSSWGSVLLRSKVARHSTKQ